MKINVQVLCRDPADHVLRRLLDVLTLVEGWGTPWPSSPELRERLPQWFVRACPASQTKDESRRFIAGSRQLSARERVAAAAQRPWSLDHWLYWMEPSKRQWYLVGTRIEAPDRLLAQLQVQGSSVGVGAFEWLAKAAGANDTLRRE
jgi:hypothetical protein